MQLRFGIASILTSPGYKAPGMLAPGEKPRNLMTHDEIKKSHGVISTACRALAAEDAHRHQRIPPTRDAAVYRFNRHSVKNLTIGESIGQGNADRFVEEVAKAVTALGDPTLEGYKFYVVYKGMKTRTTGPASRDPDTVLSHLSACFDMDALKNPPRG